MKIFTVIGIISVAVWVIALLFLGIKHTVHSIRRKHFKCKIKMQDKGD